MQMWQFEKNRVHMIRKRNKQVGRLGAVWTVGCCLMVASLFAPAETLAQDAIYQFKSTGGTSKISGKITDVSPEGATVGGNQIAAAEIKRLYFSKEPSEVNRAREHMEAGRFSDAIDELDKIDASKISGKVKPEVGFIRAFSNSQISQRGGNVTPQIAGKEVGDFIAANGNSIHLYPAIEQLGKLLFAFGRPERAADEFEKLSQCSWPEYRLKGLFQLGKSQFEAGNMEDALAAYEAILLIDSNDDLSQTYKQLAKCEKARLAGMQGDIESGLNAINGLIGTENSDNKLLFAHLYNALGSLYEKSGQLKDARTAYLHTELLFATESEPHAEALYRLAKIWLELDETDRANLARNTLKTRYRNSYWAGKL